VPRAPQSRLLTLQWYIEGLGTLRLVVPSRDRLDAVDATWPVERAATAAHRHWLWGKLMEKKPEQFAVIDADGQTISLWCSAKREVRLEGRRLYRLDYVEVRPRLRGGMAGAFTLALVGARAAEAGCQGLVLAAFPPLKGFYARAGGAQRLPKGWAVERGLVPFVFEGSAFEDFQRVVTDAARADDED